MSNLNNFSGCDLVLLASLIAISISEGKTVDELSTLSNFFSALSSNLDTIASCRGDTIINNT